MTIKYLAWVCALALVGAACTSGPTSPTTPLPAAVTAASTIAGTDAPRPTALASPVRAKLATDRRWYTVPDGLFADQPAVTAEFAEDPTMGAPRVRIDPIGREIPLSATSDRLRWSARIDLAGVAPGVYKLGVVEHVSRDADPRLGPGDAFAPDSGNDLRISAPEYVVWTLDFEGDAAGDAEMANTAAIADGLKIQMTILWNPRAWTTGGPPGESSVVSAARADAMLAWTKDRASKGDEVGLHLHMWTDYVRAAGLSPRLTPSWAGRSDGYDVPITAYPENEQQALIGYGVKLMVQHALPTPTSFRAGGQFGDAATLRAVAAAGFTADCTAVPAGTFGRLRLPWTLAADAQPYRPSRDDPNARGDLPLVESPTIGGNTFGFTTQTIQPQIRANLAVFAPAGAVATERRAVHVVSHPGTIVASERAAIEALFHAFDPLRYDGDTGPVRFVTLAQLAKAYGQ